MNVQYLELGRQSTNLLPIDDQVNPQAWLRMSLRNGSITWVTISPKGRVHIKSLGDAGHLPAELLTTH